MFTFLDIDWHSFLLGEEEWNFVFEIMLRTTIMFLVAIFSMRLVGKHGIKQRLFEIVLIITLGSAAGDAMFYKDVGIVPAIMVFIMIVLLYKLVHYLVSVSHRVDSLIEGEPAVIIKEGKFYYEEYKKLLKAQDEFLPELRVKGVSHLGQVKLAILEDSGDISIFYYDDMDVVPGLPIMPWVRDQKLDKILQPGIYSCFNCGQTFQLQAGSHNCSTCSETYWVRSADEPRIR